eukprot:605433-Rhodomonas_salina.2
MLTCDTHVVGFARRCTSTCSFSSATNACSSECPRPSASPTLHAALHPHPTPTCLSLDLLSNSRGLITQHTDAGWYVWWLTIAASVD